MAGRVALVKAVLTSITPFDILAEVQQFIDKIRKAFLWAGSDEVSGGKGKVNPETMCRPINLNGPGILHLDKLAHTLRLC